MSGRPAFLSPSRALVLGLALTAGACSSSGSPPTPVASAPRAGDKIIVGDAPMPSPDSMTSGGSTYASQQQGTGIPTMPNENPGSGLDLTLSRQR